jgi:hypothetical protein
MRLMVDLPMFTKGRDYVFDDETGLIFAVLDGTVCDYPLRVGLAGYLWLLRTDNDFGKYFKRVLEVKKPNEMKPGTAFEIG